jgi:DNA-directed RNA polymerase specialized sigma subunit
MAKGRKKTTTTYFGPEQEQAVIDYVASDSQVERNIIYNKHLREPLNKMVEYIIKRYKLYREGISFEELHADALGNLILKADKFDGTKNTKAYSYYGTIIKRYLIGRLIDDDKTKIKFDSWDNVKTSLEQTDDYQYEIDPPDIDLDKFIEGLIEGIKTEINLSKTGDKRKLTDIEEKLGDTLITMLTERETILKALSEGNKYNKIAILEIMRNISGLSTKDIRHSMKRFKTLYGIIKLDGIDNGDY